jgi:hypothetical protein
MEHADGRAWRAHRRKNHANARERTADDRAPKDALAIIRCREGLPGPATSAAMARTSRSTAASTAATRPACAAAKSPSASFC